MSEPREGLLEVGRITRPHGLGGDVYVDLSTDRTERLDRGSRLWGRGQWLTVTSAAQQTQRWLVHFEGITDRTAAERIANTRLFAEPIDDPDALWVHDLVGATVVELDGSERGRCVAVIDNPAADLLELDSGALVPVTFVVGFADGVVTIDPPEGLFD
ncbi:MAG TPA: ribosome maturation factor RimM [Ilumatobacteraceae bacterium]|nr:ribosome maturation factor RimM [Ilumatobacteraceae bacterium]